MNKKEPNAFAVYPDSVKMDLADKNKLSAIFTNQKHAEVFAHKVWPNTNIVTPIYSPHFDPDYKEPEFTAGQEVEVSDNNVGWNKRLFIGEKRNGEFIAEDNKGYTGQYNYCRPIKEKVTYYVFRDEYNERVTTDKSHADNYEIIHSFII